MCKDKQWRPAANTSKAQWAQTSKAAAGFFCSPDFPSEEADAEYFAQQAVDTDATLVQACAMVAEQWQESKESHAAQPPHVHDEHCNMAHASHKRSLEQAMNANAVIPCVGSSPSKQAKLPAGGSSADMIEQLKMRANTMR